LRTPRAGSSSGGALLTNLVKARLRNPASRGIDCAFRRARAAVWNVLNRFRAGAMGRPCAVKFTVRPAARMIDSARV
jgi:hypothetical protein